MNIQQAGHRLIELMEEAKCDEWGIESTRNLLETRTLEIAYNRAEYWFSMAGVEPPGIDKLV